MNDDELRDHLRATLGPIHPDRPDFAALRRTASRRRRRLQLTAGGLGLLLIAGAGVGIGTAFTGGNGRTQVTAAGPSVQEVTVPCQPGEVSLHMGQLLRVEACAEAGYEVFNDVQGNGQGVPEVGQQVFRAVQPGTEPLTIRYVGPCPPSPSCAAKQDGVGTITVIVVDTNSSPAVPPAGAQAVVAVPCLQARVNLAVGQEMTVVGCSPDQRTRSGTGSPGTVLQQAGPWTFRAVAGGGAVVAISQPCPSGHNCFAAPNSAVGITVNVGSNWQHLPPEIEPPCQGGRVTVSVGYGLMLTNCPAGVTSTIDVPSVLAHGGTANTFTAVGPGTTNVELYVKPVCSPGMLCPQYVRDLGTLVVTVIPRPA